MPKEHLLKQILEASREAWDRPDTRPAVRENFAKMIACRTPALGAESTPLRRTLHTLGGSASAEGVSVPSRPRAHCSKGTVSLDRRSQGVFPPRSLAGLPLGSPDSSKNDF
jgi:hypothetical protein